jgi:hypothetical protein
MAVGEAGHHRGSGITVDHGVRADAVLERRFGADGDDPPVAHRDRRRRFDGRVDPRIEAADAACDDEQLCSVL